VKNNNCYDVKTGHRGRVKLLSASMKRFKVSLQPASGRGIRKWCPRITGTFILLSNWLDYINFAYIAILLTKECIIELILLSFKKKN